MSENFTKDPWLDGHTRSELNRLFDSMTEQVRLLTERLNIAKAR